jgi:hypothetical protein
MIFMGNWRIGQEPDHRGIVFKVTCKCGNLHKNTTLLPAQQSCHRVALFLKIWTNVQKSAE